MNWIFTLYVTILFFLLTPGVLVKLPKQGSKYTVALTHTLIFAIIWQLTHKIVWNATSLTMIMPNLS